MLRVMRGESTLCADEGGVLVALEGSEAVEVVVGEVEARRGRGARGGRIRWRHRRGEPP